MASPNASISGQEKIAIVEVSVVTPLSATIAAMEDTMVEEPPVLIKSNRGRKPHMTEGEGLSSLPTQVEHFQSLRSL